MTKTIAIILQLSLLLSGCATQALTNSNNKFDRERAYATSLKEINSNVYASGSSIYYEIKLRNTTLYVRVKNNDELYLIDEAPSNKELLGVSKIIVLNENEFHENMLEINNKELPENIYVVIPEGKEYLSTSGSYKIYYSKNGNIYRKGPAINKLNDSIAHDIISTLRKGGYLITVPYDLATAPVLVGVLLLYVVAD